VRGATDPHLPLAEPTADARGPVHGQPNKQAPFSPRWRVHGQPPHLDSEVRVERLHRVANEDRGRHVQRKPWCMLGAEPACAERLTFEGQCSWKRGRQGGGGSVRQANGRAVDALCVSAFGDAIRPRRIYVGDETDVKKVCKGALEDVDRATLGT
jgi:hypothetical protein